MYYRCVPSHPVNLALEQLWKKMDELGVKIHIGPYGRVCILHGGEQFHLKDLEDSASSDRYPVEDFPPNMEYKVLVERAEPAEPVQSVQSEVQS